MAGQVRLLGLAQTWCWRRLGTVVWALAQAWCRCGYENWVWCRLRRSGLKPALETNNVPEHANVEPSESETQTHTFGVRCAHFWGEVRAGPDPTRPGHGRELTWSHSAMNISHIRVHHPSDNKVKPQNQSQQRKRWKDLEQHREKGKGKVDEKTRRFGGKGVTIRLT